MSSPRRCSVGRSFGAFLALVLTTGALGYGYDANGNIENLTDDTGSAVFTYDDLDRLTAAD